MSKTTIMGSGFDDYSFLARFQEELTRISEAFSRQFEREFAQIIELNRIYKSELSQFSASLSNQMTEISKAFGSLPAIEISDEILKSFKDAVKLYDSPTIVENMELMLSAWPSMVDSKLIEAASSLDLAEFRLQEDDSLCYEGVQYSPEEIKNELEKQIEIAKEDKLPLRERFEWLKQKLWLVLLLINLILNLPDIPEKVEFYRDMVTQAISIAQEKSRICFTVKDKSYLREEPNSAAVILRVFQYDTPLEILEAVPRWYQVKYTDANGAETIGWISKISVEEQ